jgi:hypothetical protein
MVDDPWRILVPRVWDANTKLSLCCRQKKVWMLRYDKQPP